MALTPSNMLALGIQAPEFSLINVIDGKPLSFAEVKGEKGTLVMFICVHCPYVIHVESEIARVTATYRSKGIGSVAICSNDIQKYPQDGPIYMKDQAQRNGFQMPYLFDEDQEIAKLYDAACTPDFYLFDKEDKLRYRGRLDGSRPGNESPLNGNDLRSAIDQLLAGENIPERQLPSMGCNIKWK